MTRAHGGPHQDAAVQVRQAGHPVTEDLAGLAMTVEPHAQLKAVAVLQEPRPHAEKLADQMDAVAQWRADRRALSDELDAAVPPIRCVDSVIEARLARRPPTTHTFHLCRIFSRSAHGRSDPKAARPTP